MDQIPDVSIINHSCRLLFPFYHRFNNLSDADNIKDWQWWQKRLNDFEAKKIRDSTLYFQPYVREMLFPEWRYSDKEEMHPHGTRHLTRMLNNQPFSSDFILQLLTATREPDGCPFSGKILWADTYLFSDQIGILVLAIQLTETNIALHHLADFLWAIRTVLPLYVGFNLPHLNLSTALSEKSVDHLYNLIDELLDPLVDITSLGGRKGDNYTGTLIGEEEGERCYTFTYAQVDSKQIEEKTNDIMGFNMQDIWLFELGTVTPIVGTNTPAIEYIHNLLAENRIAMWDSWSALALRDTMTFIEWKANTPFSKSVTQDYFLLYIYCLYQRLALLKLQNNLIEAGTDSHTRQRQSEDILGRMVEFRNRFWFAEVTRKVQGGELYHKYQKGLGIPTLYDFVSTEIHDLYTFFCSVSSRERAEQDKRIAEAEVDRDRKLNKRISFIATMFGIPSLTIALLGANIKGFTNTDGVSILLALLCVVGSFSLGTVLGYIITKQKIDNKSFKK